MKEKYETPEVTIEELVLEDSIAQSGVGLHENFWGSNDGN